MAFKPGNNQKFYLAVKQAGKVIGVKDSNDGARLQLLNYAANDPKQVFRFEFVDGYYWFKFPDLGKCAVVHAALQDNNAPVILYGWSGGQAHFMFEFIHAENGYYHIRLRHSGKYLELVENKDTHVYELSQNELKQQDSQLFYPVFLPEKDTGIPPSFYSTKTDLQRTIYLTLIGKIPQAGQALSFVAGYFWKDKDKLSDFWDAMKNYVDGRIRQLIKEKEIQFLEEEFLGYMNVLVGIATSGQAKKGLRLQNLMDNMIHSTPHFTDKYIEVLPLLVAYGTTLIVLRKMMCDNYDELFDEQETPAIKLSNFLALLSTIDIFTKAVDKSKAEYMKWRMDQFPDSKVISPGGTEQAVLTDNYEGITLSWLSPRYREGSPDFEFRAKIITMARQAAAKAQFELQLEELTKAARFWKYFNPMTVFIGTFTYKYIGSFGGIAFEAKVFHMEDRYTFDRADFFARNGDLCGLELFYQGKSYGLMGSSSGEKASLQLQEGEYINSVSGYAKNWIRSLWFTTNKGRKAGLGNYGDRNEFFIADLPNSFGARLHGIDGRHCEPYLRDDRVMLLTFRWKYDDYV